MIHNNYNSDFYYGDVLYLTYSNGHKETIYVGFKCNSDEFIVGFYSKDNISINALCDISYNGTHPNIEDITKLTDNIYKIKKRTSDRSISIDVGKNSVNFIQTFGFDINKITGYLINLFVLYISKINEVNYDYELHHICLFEPNADIERIIFNHNIELNTLKTFICLIHNARINITYAPKLDKIFINYNSIINSISCNPDVFHIVAPTGDLFITDEQFEINKITHAFLQKFIGWNLYIGLEYQGTIVPTPKPY